MPRTFVLGEFSEDTLPEQGWVIGSCWL